MFLLNRTRQFLPAGLLILAVLAGPGPALAGGLSTPLGEVVIENLQIGTVYDLNALAGLSLTVKNTSETGVNLQMQVLLPSESELRRDAESVPDALWVNLSADEFRLESGATATSDIIVSIPDDENLRGRTFQFTIWSRTIPDANAGMALAFGLKSRIIFTTAAEPVTPRDGTSLVGSGGVILSPAEMFAENVGTGQPHDLTQSQGLILEVTNPSNLVQTYALECLTVADSLAPATDGYVDPPSASYLTLSEPELELAPGETRQVQMFVEIPEGPEHQGKKYVFVIHARSTGGEVSSGVYSRLYASID